MYQELEDRLGYRFRDVSLLEQAFTHVSYAKEKGTKHYENLEFLGDSLLNFLIVDLLVSEFPTKREGTLATLKAYLISEEFFHELAQELELSKYILMSRGESDRGSPHNVSIVSDVFEALWAAIYIDSGGDCNLVKELFNSLFRERIVNLIREGRVRKDFKTELQEITQKRWKERPTYRVMSVEGPSHDRTFSVECSIKDLRTVGTGKSKKQAEQEAAKKMVKLLTSSSSCD
jgi:ribonuclease-3